MEKKTDANEARVMKIEGVFIHGPLNDGSSVKGTHITIDGKKGAALLLFAPEDGNKGFCQMTFGDKKLVFSMLVQTILEGRQPFALAIEYVARKGKSLLGDLLGGSNGKIDEDMGDMPSTAKH